LSTTSTQRTDSPAPGAESPQRNFPWWLLLLGVALIVLVAILVTRGGDDGDLATDSEQTQESQTADDGDAPAQDEADEPGAGDGDATTDGTADSADVQPGKVTAGGATVYPLQDDLTVADYDGVEVMGRDVPVESVVADEGFWIGTSADDRIFVRVTGTGTESAPDIQAGDTIDFDGVVVTHDDGFAQEVGVERNEGAQRLTALGGHIEIGEYRLAN
jgi:hypothetical protein